MLDLIRTKTKDSGEKLDSCLNMEMIFIFHINTVSGLGVTIHRFKCSAVKFLKMCENVTRKAWKDVSSAISRSC